MINGCLPVVVVVGYCPSDGYSGLSSEAEPTTKDTSKPSTRDDMQQYDACYDMARRKWLGLMQAKTEGDELI